MALTTKIRALRNEAKKPNNDDYIVLDGNTSGTRKMLVNDINKEYIHSVRYYALNSKDV